MHRKMYEKHKLEQQFNFNVVTTVDSKMCMIIVSNPKTANIMQNIN